MLCVLWPYHVVGVLSGVGEEVLLLLHDQPLILLHLQLLLLLELPAMLGTLYTLLNTHTHTPSCHCLEQSIQHSSQTPNTRMKNHMDGESHCSWRGPHLGHLLILSAVQILQVVQGVPLYGSQLGGGEEESKSHYWRLTTFTRNIPQENHDIGGGPTLQAHRNFSLNIVSVTDIPIQTIWICH